MGAPPRLIKEPPPKPPSNGATSTPPPSKLEAAPVRRRRRSLVTSPLPSLRLLLHPHPGLGVDLRLPLSQRTRCYMQLESFFNGPSSIRIGLHPKNLPGLRFQLSPTPRFSVRIPIRLDGAKYLHLGFYADTRWGLQGGWDADQHVFRLGKMRQGWTFGGFVEMWRYTTAASMVDRRFKEGLKEALGRRKRATGFDGRGLDGVSVDPREKEELREIMKELLRERYRQRGTVPGGKFGPRGEDSYDKIDDS